MASSGSSTTASAVFGLAATAAVTCHTLRSHSGRAEARRASNQRERLRKLSAKWRKELWQSVVPFWLNNAVDSTHGGFFTCLDRDGGVLDDTKYHWLQGRAVWTCSRLCHKLLSSKPLQSCPELPENVLDRLLQAAHGGARFLKFAKEGSFSSSGAGAAPDEAGQPIYFSTTRDGWPLHIQRKPYTAVFYVFGCLEYSQLLACHPQAAAEKFDCSISEIESIQEHFRNEALNAFEFVRQCIEDSTLCGRLPSRHSAMLSSPRTVRGRSGSDFAVDLDTGRTVLLDDSSEHSAHEVAPVAKMSSLAEVMCLSALSEEFLAAVPEQRHRWDGYVDDSLGRVLKHYCPRFKVFMEEAHPELGVQHDTPSGRMFNPGHSIEVAWFLLHLCRLKDERDGPDASAEHRKVALSVLENSLVIGWDTANGGGITYMMDILGRPLQDCTVTAEHKLWWPLCEALYALTLVFTQTRDDKWLVWLERVHDYIMTHLSDFADLRKEPKKGIPANCKGGEWFGYLRPDGTVFNACKGGNYKGFFHVPRALLYSLECAENFLSSE
eukprot:INCI13443.13.p1 GENE.INCI13443.13~~INCI13443.13.p1  ORF type:complete len:551 (-),score=70.05 INCI13443.13:1682-3334(-)